MIMANVNLSKAQANQQELLEDLFKV